MSFSHFITGRRQWNRTNVRRLHFHGPFRSRSKWTSPSLNCVPWPYTFKSTLSTIWPLQSRTFLPFIVGLVDNEIICMHEGGSSSTYFDHREDKSSSTENCYQRLHRFVSTLSTIWYLHSGSFSHLIVAIFGHRQEGPNPDQNVTNNRTLLGQRCRPFWHCSREHFRISSRGSRQLNHTNVIWCALDRAKPAVLVSTSVACKRSYP